MKDQVAATGVDRGRRPRAWVRLVRYPPAVISLAVLLVLTGLVVAAPIVSRFGPLDVSDEPLKAPDRTHWVGTDEVGRDVFTRLLYGGRVSLAVGLVSTVFIGVAGVTVGLIAGAASGFREAIIMRIVDGLLAFPPIVLALAILTIIPSNTTTVSFAVSMPLTPRFARLVRAEVLRIRGEVYIEAARAVGAPPAYILIRVLLPNAMAPIFVGLSLMFGLAILLEATVGFLGLGIQAPYPTWGYMINRGAIYLGHNPWYAVGAGVAIFVCVLAANRLGDALRDLLDPRLRGIS